MRDFFEGVGTGDAAGVWHSEPTDRTDFRAKYRKALDIQAKRRNVEEAV